MRSGMLVPCIPLRECEVNHAQDRHDETGTSSGTTTSLFPKHLPDEDSIADVHA